MALRGGPHPHVASLRGPSPEIGRGARKGASPSPDVGRGGGRRPGERAIAQRLWTHHKFQQNQLRFTCLFALEPQPQVIHLVLWASREARDLLHGSGPRDPLCLQGKEGALHPIVIPLTCLGLRPRQ